MYSDLDLGFLPHPRTRDVSRVTGDAAVKRAIRMLLDTLFGERVFQPEIGSNIRSLLFEPQDSITERLLVEELRRVITTYEPRAQLVEVRVDTPDELSLNLQIVLRILPQQTTTTMVLDFNRSQLLRVR